MSLLGTTHIPATRELIGDNTYTRYKYDRLDRLETVWRYRALAGKDFETEAYEIHRYAYYGPTWMRKSSTVETEWDGAGNPTETKTTDYFYDGFNCIAQETGGVISEYFHLGTTPLWSSEGATSTNYLTDSQGSITGAVASGQVADERVFDAFGGTVAHREQGNSPHYSSPGYRGQLQDPTGMVFMRNRFYDPEIGRFNQLDSARAGSNWYTYSQNPVRNWDPMGHADADHKGIGYYANSFFGALAPFGRPGDAIIDKGAEWTTQFIYGETWDKNNNDPESGRSLLLEEMGGNPDPVDVRVGTKKFAKEVLYDVALSLLGGRLGHALDGHASLKRVNIDEYIKNTKILKNTRGELASLLSKAARTSPGSSRSMARAANLVPDLPPSLANKSIVSTVGEAIELPSVGARTRGKWIQQADGSYIPARRSFDIPGQSTYRQRLSRTSAGQYGTNPRSAELGNYSGARGESVFTDSGGLGSVPYRNAEVDFSEYSIGRINMDNSDFLQLVDQGGSINRGPLHSRADSMLATQWNAANWSGGGWTKAKVTQFRRDHNFTWHEYNDMITLDLVPTEVNGTFQHLGGFREAALLLEYLRK